MMKGLSKFERMLRAIKTLVFLITMLASLLLLSAPLLLLTADILVSCVVLSVSLPFSSNLKNYDFRHSLVDVPLVSIARSLVVFCVYWFCDGRRICRWYYLGATMLCCLVSLVFVSIKAPYVFGNIHAAGVPEMALFMTSIVFGVGHIVVAYRISCRERRKLLVYKIDVEAVHLKLGVQITSLKMDGILSRTLDVK